MTLERKYRPITSRSNSLFILRIGIRTEQNEWKIKKRKHTERAVFYVYVIFWQQSGQAGVENGAMLTTYVFRYTSECTVS